MIEKVILDYLSSVITVPCYMEEPEEKEKDFILIQKTSSSGSNQLDSAVMAIQSYGSTLYEAAELNDKVKKAMRNIITLNVIAKCRLNSDYNFTDTQTKRYRYQAVFDINYYEE